MDFQGSFSILEAEQGLMAFPVLLLDQETFSARQALPGPVNSLGKESTTLRHQFFPVSRGRELVTSYPAWKPGAF